MTIKVLWYSDFLCTTGFGNVAEELIERLMKKTTTVEAKGPNTAGVMNVPQYNFTVLGINHFGEPYNTPESPYYKFKDIPVYPSRGQGRDWLGHQKLVDMLVAGDFDVLFVLQDTFNMVPLHDALFDICSKKRIPYIFYFPVDSDLDAVWVEKGVSTADIAVTYTQYGAQEVRKHGGEVEHVIFHGADTSVFYPLSDEERLDARKRLFNLGPDDFIVTNVNRNQPRKDVARTILGWLKLKEKMPHAKLYLHTHAQDPLGADLTQFLQSYVPKEYQEDIMWPQLKGFGFTLDQMREVYAASDVVVSTTRGEGWGFSTTEAMACKVPVVMPRHTSLEEMVGENEERGRLIECSSEFVLPRGDNMRVRPTVDLDDFARQICRVRDEPKTTAAQVEAAYKWVKQECDWDKIAEQWHGIFKRATGK